MRCKDCLESIAQQLVTLRLQWLWRRNCQSSKKAGFAENHTQKQKFKNLLPNRGGCDKIYIIKQNKNFV